MPSPTSNAPAILAVAGIILLTLSACSSTRETQPKRTATEQLLISSAADRAADRLTPHIPAATKVFVDTSNFEGYDSKYAIGSLRDRLLRSGARLVADRKDADMVVELRSGALSINQHSLLIGLPSIPIPIPLAGTVKTPEIALFKRSEDQGVAKFAATALDAKKGTLTDSTGPVYGFSHQTDWVLLLFFSWSTNDLVPEGSEQVR